MVIQNLDITGLPGLINAAILLSGMSCGNGHLYSSSITLYGLARDGQAPRFLVKCTEYGVLIYCVALVSLITCITFLVAAIPYFGCKVWRGIKTVDPRTADLVSGKAEVDEECRVLEEDGIEENDKATLMEMPFWKRCWESGS